MRFNRVFAGRAWASCVALLVIGLVLLTLLQPVWTGEDFYGLLGVDRGANQKEIRQAFKKKALSMHPDKNADNPDAHDEFLKINRAYEVLKDEELRKKYDQHGEEGLKENVPSGGGYRSWKFYQQEFGLYDDDPNIITLSRSDFEASVQNTQDVWFINFYSPHCSHCHELAPIWKQLAQDLDGVVRMGAVNCEDEWMLCRQRRIHSYPSVLMFPKAEKFNGDRSLRELTRFAMRSVDATVTDLWLGNFKSVASEADKLHHPWVINFCNNIGDCMQKQSVKKLAAMLNDLVNVGAVDCRHNEKLCSDLGVEVGVYFFEAGHLGKDAATGKGIESLDAKEVAQFVLRQLPEVSLLDKENLTGVLQRLEQTSDEVPWLIHFVNGDSTDLELRKLPILLGNIQVGRVNCQQVPDLCTELYMQKLPSFVLFKAGGDYEIHHGRMAAMDIAAFAKDSMQSGVTVLSPADFPVRVIYGTDSWFVDFYAPWCPPCMRLLPEFRKASKQVPHPNVHFGTVDCTVHQDLCSTYDIHSYPTTIFYNRTQPHHFHGHHTVQALVEFITDTLNPPVQALTDETFPTVVNYRESHQMVFVDYFAPWCGPCQHLAPEWRRFSKMMASTPHVTVAHVDCVAHSALCQAQSITGYPTIRFYPPGHLGSSQYMQYLGMQRDAYSIYAWAYTHLPSKSATLHDQNFVNLVLQSTEHWLVDFYTPWCGHCHTFAPDFEKIAQMMDGVVHTGKVNCAQNQFVCQQASIRAYPTVRFYHGTPTAGHQQGFYGEDVNSQSVHQIINFLKQRGLQSKQLGHDEL